MSEKRRAWPCLYPSLKTHNGMQRCWQGRRCPRQTPLEREEELFTAQGSFVRRGPSRFVRETLKLGREALPSEQALKITPGGRQKRATSETYFPFQQSPGWGMEGWFCNKRHPTKLHEGWCGAACRCAPGGAAGHYWTCRSLGKVHPYLRTRGTDVLPPGGRGGSVFLGSFE